MASSAQSLYLIGDLEPTITGDKLPSNLQVLKFFLYNMRVKKMTARQSCKIVLQKVGEFWKRADVLALHPRNTARKLMNLYKDFSGLVRRQRFPSDIQKALVKDFTSELDDLFDIAPSNIEGKISKERMQFLMNQRKKGRVGAIDDSDSDQKENSQNENNKIASPKPRKRKIEQAKPAKADGEKEEEIDGSQKKSKITAGSGSKDDDSSTASGDEEAESADDEAEDGPSGPKKVRKSARKPKK